MTSPAPTSTATRAEAAVTERLRELRVIPVATVPAGRAAELGAMLVRAGLPCLEIAMRDAEASTAIEQAVAVENLLVGAGTVLSAEQAEAAAAAGAHLSLIHI